jgi:hypothetical protein
VEEHAAWRRHTKSLEDFGVEKWEEGHLLQGMDI